MKKRFRGRSPVIIDKDNKIRDFYTTAASEGQGIKILRHKMNRERGCVPEAIIPGMEIVEVPPDSNAP